ncbi:cupredoxin domain-containing protein [Saccharothrix hoggarensis]|uniref:EfeO-type cupredoxin-like domain-containing protein n=1 Tax=Saccharothrix hoggarensis TaxID=913853 RepID=A0ABW3R0H5_9PSEU
MIRVLLLATLAALAVLVPAGCTSAPAPAPASTEPLVLRLSVDDASPQQVEAVRGQAVELTVTSAEPVEVHVHGIDVLAKAEEGKPAVLEFTVDRTGTFDVEAHPDTLLVQLVVR